MSRLLGLSVMLACMTALSWTVKASWDKNGSTLDLTQESCPNGYFDPGETNVVTFSIKNTTGGDIKEVQVELVADGADVGTVNPSDASGIVSGSNVEFVLTPKTDPQDVAKDASISATFKFRVSGTCGRSSFVNPKLLVTYKNSDGTRQTPDLVTFSGDKLAHNGQLGATVETHYSFNGGQITINDLGNSDHPGTATPYPSKVTVADVPNNLDDDTGERVSNISVTLNGVTHPTQTDVAALLVGPGANPQKVVLFRGAGNSVGGFANTTFTISSASDNVVPLNAPIQNGQTYGEADYNPGVNFLGAAPPGPYAANLDVFKNVSANGTWSLYLIDSVNNGGGASGAVSGWTMTVTTEKIVCCNGTATPPSITQYTDDNKDYINPDHKKRPKATIADVTTLEDSIFASNNTSDLNPNGKPVSTLSSFKVSDILTASDAVALSAVSGDQTKLKSSNVKFATVSQVNGSFVYANRTMEFQTEPNANGDVPVTIIATDSAGATSSASFTLHITAINDAPVFNVSIPNQSMNIGTTTPPLPFTVSDVETATGSLVLTVKSSDENVVPASNVLFTGLGTPDSAITVIPRTPSTSGRATITITATDTGNPDGSNVKSTDMVFTVDFSTAAGYPTISPFDNKTSDEDQSKSIGFTVRSASSTPVDSLVITVNASNPALIPTSNISITGTGTSRTLTYTPVQNANSWDPTTQTVANKAQITVQVSDGAKSSSQSFFVTVNPVNDKPVIANVPSPLTIAEGSETTALPFTVGDIETFNGDLIAAGRSSNPNIVPTPNITIGNKVYGVIVNKPGTNPQDRTVKIVPLPHAFGRVTIFLDVTDTQQQGVGPDTSTYSFTLEVQPVNDQPSIGAVVYTDNSGSTQTTTLASNSNDAPLAATLDEGTGITKNSDGSFTINAQTIQLGVQATSANPTPDGGIYPGVPPSTWPTGISLAQGPLNETEQTVTIGASVDNPGIISSVYFDPGDDAKVKYGTPSNPKTKTNLRFKLVPYAYGDAVVTLTLTDNGTGALGGDNQTTVRKFKVHVNPVNNQPTLTASAPTGDLPQGVAVIVPITAKDIETAPANMTIIATSDNTTVVPVANIIANPGAGVVSVIPVAPNPLVDTDVKITLTAKDRGATDDGKGQLGQTTPSIADGTIFTLHFRNDVKINHAPTLSALSPSSATIAEDGLATATATIDDPDGSADINGATLIVASTSDPNILPASGVMFGGAGQATRSIAFVPNKYANGSVTVKIAAKDPQGFTSVAQSFDLTVIAVENPPTISVAKSTDSGTAWSGSTITANEDVSAVADPKTASGLIEVTVFDPETPAGQLTLSASSDNQTLVPDGNITFGSDIVLKNISGLSSQFQSGTRTVTIKPVANRSGTANITLKVKDAAGNEVSTGFAVLIQPVNDAPTINNPVPSGSITIGKNAPVQSLTLSGITAGPEEGGQTTNPSVPAQVLTLKAVAINKGSNPDDHKNDYIIPITGTADQIQAIFTSTSSATATATPDALTGLLTFQPKPNVFGTSTIIITVSDNGGTDRGGVNNTKVQFDVVIGDVNNAPTITISPSFLDITFPPGQSSPVIPISVNDAPNETPPNDLTLSFSSSNTNLVPNVPSSFQQTGSGTSRGVIVTPLANTFGSTFITITVTDTGKADHTDVKSSSATMKLSVAAGQSPTISSMYTNSVPTTNVVTTVNRDSDIITFIVNDAQTPADQLTVTASSDNQTVVPDGNIQFGGSGGNRMMIIRPAANQAGIANIVVRVRDTDSPPNVTATTFRMTVLGAPPTISSVADQNIQVGGSTGPLAFQVNSATTYPGFLVVTGSSSDKRVVPDANIFLGGSGVNRTVNVVGAAGQSGSSTITLSVQDSQGQVVSTTFKVSTPNVANTAPTISSIGNQTVTVGQTLPIITFTVGDTETPVGDLKVTATSSNTTLIPAGNIFLGGNGANRTMLLTLASGKTGQSSMIVTVTDGGGKSSTTGFTVTVNPVGPKSIANDFNGDGVPDIIFQDNGGFLGYWFMSGDDMVSSGLLTPNAVGDVGWKVVGSADFNADGKPDLLFQHTDGSLAVWMMDGVSFVSGSYLTPANAGTWKVVGIGDFNGDTKPDLLLQAADGSLAIWYMDGLNLTSAAMLNPSAPADKNWLVVGVGDVNGDGKPDIFFQHTDGTLAVWYMNNANLVLGSYLTPATTGDPNWRVVGVTDQNGDKKPDLLFQNKADGTLAIWYMNGAKLLLGKALNPSNASGTWHIVAP